MIYFQLNSFYLFVLLDAIVVCLISFCDDDYVNQRCVTGTWEKCSVKAIRRREKFAIVCLLQVTISSVTKKKKIMVDNLPDLVNRAWISTNSDNNNVNNTASISHSLHPHSFFRKTSDNSNNHNSNNNLHQHVNRQFIQSPLKIVITNHDDSSSLRHEAASKILSNHRTVDSGHVTDGEIGISASNYIKTSHEN